jgi:hypothetical protein
MHNNRDIDRLQNGCCILVELVVTQENVYMFHWKNSLLQNPFSSFPSIPLTKKEKIQKKPPASIEPLAK